MGSAEQLRWKLHDCAASLANGIAGPRCNRQNQPYRLRISRKGRFLFTPGCEVWSSGVGAPVLVLFGSGRPADGGTVLGNAAEKEGSLHEHWFQRA